MEEVIDLASDDKFSEFSKKVKQSLEDKLRNNATMKDNANKKDKFTGMADKFKEISGAKEEPAKVDDTKVDDTKVDDTKVDDTAATVTVDDTKVDDTKVADTAAPTEPKSEE